MPVEVDHREREAARAGVGVRIERIAGETGERPEPPTEWRWIIDSDDDVPAARFDLNGGHLGAFRAEIAISSEKRSIMDEPFGKRFARPCRS
ncbi:hypothetical protein BRX37_20080 [Sphingomonas sp. S-NIH.Pt3_0716]|nr:hypothetical protein BRX37_20080 [Sphingomonas sp. S-NIH.Pt3_0716]